MTELGEIFQFVNGRGFRKNEWTNHGLPIIRIQNLNNLSAEYNLYNGSYNKKIEVNNGDLLFSWSGTVGSSFGPHIWDRDTGLLNQHIYKLEFKKDINKKYAYYSLLFITEEIEKKVNGAVGLVHITKEKLNKFTIPLPPLSEQKRIVAILDEAFAAIDKAKVNAEKNLANAKELFESYLNGIFANPGDDWEEKTLNEIAENLDSKRIPITKNVRKEGKIPYYGASGIVDYVADFIFDEDLLCISEDGANLLARTYPIAFSISGKTWVNNHAHVLRFEKYISQKYVELYLNSIKLDDFVSGMAQPKLNQAMLNKIPIPFPSVNTQESIVDKLQFLSNEIKKFESTYKNKIYALDELKKSILKKAFEEEL